MNAPLPFFLLLLGITAFGQAPLPPGDQAAPVPFTTIESIVAVIPPNIDLKTGSKWNVIGVEQANEAIMSRAKDRPATLRLKVQVFEPFKETGWGYRIMAPEGDISIRGTKIGCRAWAYFRPDQAETLIKVRKGSAVTLTGTLGRADIKMYDGRPALSLDLHDAKLEKP